MKIIKKLLILAGCMVMAGIGAVSAADRTYPSIKVFDDEVVAGNNDSGDTTMERATSTGYNIDGSTSIGYAYHITQATSTPHIGIGYQLSMDNASWTATIMAEGDVQTTTYTATQTAVTLPPSEWIRWILRTDPLNAEGTVVDFWFKRRKD